MKNKKIIKYLGKGIVLAGTIACAITISSLSLSDSSNKIEKDDDTNLASLGIASIPDYLENEYKTNNDYIDNTSSSTNNTILENSEVYYVDESEITDEVSIENNYDYILEESSDTNIVEESTDTNILEDSNLVLESEEEVSEKIDEPRDIFISVNDYGVVGDGITDNTKAINKILKSCNGIDNYTIYFPNGNYLVSNSIVIYKSNIHLLGDTNTTLFFPEDIILEQDKKRIIGLLVVKTINQDVSNVSIENLNINVGANEEKWGKESSLGRGITIIRQGKYEDESSLNYYKMFDISIINCNVINTYSYGIAAVGGEQLKEEYDIEYLNELKNNYYQDYDNRNYYNFYDINNLVITGCHISNSRIGIRVNRANFVTILSNYINNSRYENMTAQVQNATISYNELYNHMGGAGSLTIDKSENTYIVYNKIDESSSVTTKDIWKTGICQNSAAGPSYNITINYNYINGAVRGIWIKNNLLTANPHQKDKAGSRPGAGYIIKGNKIFNSLITDIRLDELDNVTIDGSYIGNSVLYPGNCSINLEAYDSSEKIGDSIKLEDIEYLDIYKTSTIKIGIKDEDDNFIENNILQIEDEYGNIYGNYLSSDSEIIVDLPIGNYILKNLDSNESIEFSVENEDGQEQEIYFIEKQIDNEEFEESNKLLIKSYS